MAIIFGVKGAGQQPGDHMSIFATFVSSISYLGLPGQAYISNWNPLVFSLSIPVASYMAVKFFVPLYRSEGSASAYTYFGNRFGAWAKYYAATMYLLTQLMRAGTILFLLAISLNLLLGWSIVMIVVVMGVSVMIYSFLGGESNRNQPVEYLNCFRQ